MKMKVSGFITFALLSITILSFGLTGAVNAQSQTVQDGLTLPLSVSTELPSYANGDNIINFRICKRFSRIYSICNCNGC